MYLPSLKNTVQKNNLNTTIMKINIKTLSPVFIGGSEADNLSPYSDYIQHDDKIILLDQKKLSELISKDNSIIEKYVSIVILSLSEGSQIWRFFTCGSE